MGAVRLINPQRGLTIVEILVAATILIVVLGLATSFLTEQASVQRAVQARNQVQDLVRVVMNFTTQDLALTGTNFIVRGGGVEEVAGITLTERVGALCLGVEFGCLTVDSESGDPALAVRYLNSQVAAGEASCRAVRYTLEDETLSRFDLPCLGTMPTTELDRFILSNGVTAFAIEVSCSNEEFDKRTTATTRFAFAPGDCGLFGYARKAVVTIAARVPLRGADSPGCDPGFACFGVTQEVLMPNLKDR